MKRLGVNIDHVATVRNARGELYPSPLRAALLAQKSGAESVTIHLREDRRHIREFDLKEIKSKLKIPLNLEIAATKEMLNIALKAKPDFICIVPEKRQELTTEGGLNLKHKRIFLINLIKKLKKNKFRVSLFIEPSIKDIKDSQKLNADCPLRIVDEINQGMDSKNERMAFAALVENVCGKENDPRELKGKGKIEL